MKREGLMKMMMMTGKDERSGELAGIQIWISVINPTLTARNLFSKKDKPL